MHEVLVNRLGGLSLPRKSVVRLTDRPDMTLDVYRGRKTTIQYNTIDSLSLPIPLTDYPFLAHQYECPERAISQPATSASELASALASALE